MRWTNVNVVISQCTQVLIKKVKRYVIAVSAIYEWAIPLPTGILNVCAKLDEKKKR